MTPLSPFKVLLPAGNTRPQSTSRAKADHTCNDRKDSGNDDQATSSSIYPLATPQQRNDLQHAGADRTWVREHWEREDGPWSPLRTWQSSNTASTAGPYVAYGSPATSIAMSDYPMMHDWPYAQQPPLDGGMHHLQSEYTPYGSDQPHGSAPLDPARRAKKGREFQLKSSQEGRHACSIIGLSEVQVSSG